MSSSTHSSFTVPHGIFLNPKLAWFNRSAVVLKHVLRASRAHGLLLACCVRREHFAMLNFFAPIRHLRAKGRKSWFAGPSQQSLFLQPLSLRHRRSSSRIISYASIFSVEAKQLSTICESPKKQRARAAQTYLKMVSRAAWIFSLTAPTSCKHHPASRLSRRNGKSRTRNSKCCSRSLANRTSTRNASWKYR